MTMRTTVYGAGPLLATVLACGGNPMPAPPLLPAMGDVTPAEWAALASRKVFFGHQSVGGNIALGLTEVLAAHPEIHVTVVETKDLNRSASPGFYHAWIGRNEHPVEKAEEFAAIATAGLAAPGAVGMMKFCYVDVKRDTDPRALFESYQKQIAGVRERDPGLTIVHFTMPITTNEGFLRHWRLRLRGYHTERDLNIVRNRYNALLRQAYVGKEPVFDIAALEARRPDGTWSYFRHFGEIVYTMTPESTKDGGHLNEAGRRMVAEQLLIFLAKLPSPAGRPQATT